MTPMKTRKLQIVTMQKDLWIFKFNYNFGPQLLNKSFELDANLVQETAGLE